MLNCFGSSHVLTPVSRQCLKSRTFSLCLSLVSSRPNPKCLGSSHVSKPLSWPMSLSQKRCLASVTDNGAGAKKTKMTLLLVDKLWRCVHSFRHNISIGQTDRRTDTRICRNNIALWCIVCRRAIKTNQKQKQISAINILQFFSSSSFFSLSVLAVIFHSLQDPNYMLISKCRNCMRRTYRPILDSSTLLYGTARWW